MQAAILFNIGEEEIVARLSQRLHCVSCNNQFNSASAKPKSPGVCDECGSQLAKREDDQPQVIRHRFKVYKRQTEPLARHYRAQGLLTEVSASDTIEAVNTAISSAIKEASKQ